MVPGTGRQCHFQVRSFGKLIVHVPVESAVGRYLWSRLRFLKRAE